MFEQFLEKFVSTSHLTQIVMAVDHLAIAIKSSFPGSIESDVVELITALLNKSLNTPNVPVVQPETSEKEVTTSTTTQR